MPQIIAVANLKGGVGKSTIAVNLASSLAADGASAAIIDADSQGTASFWEMQGHLPIAARAPPLEEAAERGLISRLVSTEASRERVRIEDWKAALTGGGEDYLVIDCPPHVGLATRAALALADLVVVPVTASTADVAATAPALHLIRKARDQRPDKGPKCLIVPSKVDRSTATGRSIEIILKRFGETVGPAICQRVAFADSVAFGQWIGSYAKGSAADLEIRDLTAAVKRALAG